MEIDIDAEKFRTKGNSKLIRLFSFLKTSPPKNAGEVLRALYDHKTAAQRNDLRASMAFSSYTMDNIELIDAQQTALNLEDEDFEIFVSAIECRKEDQVAEHLTIVADHFDFDTVVREITRARDFVENDPEDAITAACSLLEAVGRSILIELKLELPKDISLKTTLPCSSRPAETRSQNGGFARVDIIGRQGDISSNGQLSGWNCRS